MLARWLRAFPHRHGPDKPGHDEEATGPAAKSFSIRRLILTAMQTRPATTGAHNPKQQQSFLLPTLPTTVPTRHLPSHTGRSGGAERTTARPASPNDRSTHRRS